MEFDNAHLRHIMLFLYRQGKNAAESASEICSVHGNDVGNDGNDFGWELMSHPAYSPDLAPSDYHLFLELKTFLREKNFKNPEELRKGVAEYFSFKNEEFYLSGIHDLLNRWEKVMAVKGDYFYKNLLLHLLQFFNMNFVKNAMNFL